MRFSGLALEMLVFIFLGVWVGYELDQYFQLKYPVFTILLSMVALVGGMVYLIKKLPHE